MKSLTCCAFALCWLPTLPAQAPVAKAPGADPRVQRMREQIGAGKDVRSHVRVAVRLANGNRIFGVVKDIRLVERVDGVRFAKADAGDAGAGIRLWYHDGRNSYVFLPFTDIKDYRIEERLTTIQLAELARQYGQTEAEAAAAGAATGVDTPTGEAQGAGAAPVEPAAGQSSGTPDATPPARAEGAASRGAVATPPANGDLDESQKKLFALLQQYPPAAGWNQVRRDEIARRKVVVGAAPSAAEQKFVDSYADWQRACALFGVEPEAKEPEPATGEATRRTRRKKG